MDNREVARELVKVAKELVSASFRTGDKVKIEASEKEFNGEEGKIYHALTEKLRGYYQVLLTSGPKKGRIVVFHNDKLTKI